MIKKQKNETKKNVIINILYNYLKICNKKQ